MVCKMHPTLLVPTLFYLVVLLAAVPVRVSFIRALLEPLLMTRVCPSCSSYMPAIPTFITGTTTVVVTHVITAAMEYKSPISLRVGRKSDATRRSSHDLYKRIDFLTLTPIRDNVAARTLISASFTDTKNMTVENCVNFCNKLNFIYAGVEFAQECCKSCFSVVPVSPRIRYMLITRFGAIDCGNVVSNGGRTAP